MIQSGVRDSTMAEFDDNDYTIVVCPTCDEGHKIFHPHSDVCIFCLECGTTSGFAYNGNKGYYPAPKFIHKAEGDEAWAKYMKESVIQVPGYFTVGKVRRTRNIVVYNKESIGV